MDVPDVVQQVLSAGRGAFTQLVDDGLLPGQVADSLAAGARQLPSVTVAAVGAFGQVPAPVVASALAASAFPSRVLRTDFVLATPASDRWTVAEIDDLVLRPASRRPSARNVIVVANVDRVDTRLWPRLLKTLEEPLAPTTFLLCVNDLADLPVTVSGRCQVTFLDGPARVEPVDLSGLPEGPFAAAAALVARVESSVSGVDARKAQLRVTSRAVIGATRDLVGARLRSVGLSAQDLELCRWASETLDDADVAIDRYCPPQLVLSTVFAVRSTLT